MKGKRKKKSIWTTFAASRNSVPEQMEALSFRGFLTYTKQFSGDRERGFCLDASVWNQIRGKHAFPQHTPCVTLNMHVQLQLLFSDLKQSPPGC